MYPKDGKTFDFSTIVKKTFMLHINGSFWIRKDGQNLTITKDGKGFIRCTEI